MLKYRGHHVLRLLVQELVARLRRSGLQRQRSATVLMSLSTSMSATTTSVAVSYFILANALPFYAKFLEGSTTVYPYNDTTYEPVELGASIFVEVNKNMQRAASEFNLSLDGYEDEDGSMGIWDGEQFLYTVRFSQLTTLSS